MAVEVVVSVDVIVVVVVSEVVREDDAEDVPVVVCVEDAVVVAVLESVVVGVDSVHPTSVPSMCELSTRFSRLAAAPHSVPDRASTTPLIEQASCTLLPPGYPAMTPFSVATNPPQALPLRIRLSTQLSREAVVLTHARVTVSRRSTCWRHTSSLWKRSVCESSKQLTLP